MKVYLAGPLFTQAEQQWMRALANGIRLRAAAEGVSAEVLWPYDLAGPDDIAAWGERAKREIYDRCVAHLDTSDTLVAVLEGTQVDDGTAWEIGYFHARLSAGRRIIGLRTDFRKSGDMPNAVVNLMIDCACHRIVGSVDDLMAVLFA